MPLIHSSTIDEAAAMHLTSKDRTFYLFGHPIAHSLSPIMHNAMFSHLGLPWTYQLHESTDLDAFLSHLHQPECYGSSVTMPFKVAILPHLDELTVEAREVGACNTIFVREEIESGQDRKVYVGTNTDVVGIREAFLRNIDNPHKSIYDKPAMVIGGGGAARSAIYAFHKWLRASQIYIVNRDPAEVDAVITECTARGFGSKIVYVSSVAQARELTTPAAVVSCIPDFEPKTAGELEARQIAEAFMGSGAGGHWVEMAYHPRLWPALARMAKEKQWNVIVGTEPMFWQGFEQSRLWTGLPLSKLPLGIVRGTVNDAIKKGNAEKQH